MNGLKTEPEKIYNVDETGMLLDHCPPKIVTQRGHKKVQYRTARKKSQITVIRCVSATGHAIAPFVIWDAKSMNKEWTVGEVPGTTYGLSSKGWVDSELFRGWIVDHFIPLAVAGRPLLLMLDGHSHTISQIWFDLLKSTRSSCFASPHTQLMSHSH